MSIYEKLGLQPLVNAAGTYTAVGGSRMSNKTLELMKEASSSFVNIRDLQKAVGRRLAELTKNEAAAVCNGAASGLYVACASCITTFYKKPYQFLDRSQIEKAEFIVFRAHRNPYDWGLRLMGVKVRELGFPNIIQTVSEEELHASINENTAGVFFAFSAPHGWIADGELSLQTTITIAQKYKVPVIVDAAAQLPPVENLWKLTEMGADAVLFSGGKDLKGPQSSGLIVGKKAFIDIFTEMNFPNYGPGRMLKTGREEIVGLLNAVEEYVFMDHQKRLAWCEEEAAKLIAFGEKSFVYKMKRSYPNEAGQPIPRVEILLKNEKNLLSKVVDLLLEQKPAVYSVIERGRLFISPTCLEEGDMDCIIKHLAHIEKQLL